MRGLPKRTCALYDTLRCSTFYDLEWLHTFVNEVNARFVQEDLDRQGIDTDFREVEHREQPLFELWVSERDFADAKLAIVEMNLDESLPHPDSEGQLAQTVDWMENMYNPGHYLSRPLPIAGMNARASMALGGVLMLAGVLLASGAEPPPWPWKFWGWIVGLFLGGTYLIWAGWRAHKARGNDAS